MSFVLLLTILSVTLILNGTTTNLAHKILLIKGCSLLLLQISYSGSETAYFFDCKAFTLAYFT